MRAARLRALALALAASATPAIAATWDLPGPRTLTAVTQDQQRITLGTVHFDVQPDGSARFAIRMDPARFTDHFLSMKEFKCLEGPAELMCHVPYPDPQPGTVSDGQLAWLEHGLLFLFKRPGEFGAKLWNGLYFQLERTPQGLRGKAQAVDLNRISAPPDRPAVPPYRPALRDEVRPGSRWIETLLIE